MRIGADASVRLLGLSLLFLRILVILQLWEAPS
jgi:hypothetical protein